MPPEQAVLPALLPCPCAGCCLSAQHPGPAPVPACPAPRLCAGCPVLPGGPHRSGLPVLPTHQRLPHVGVNPYLHCRVSYLPPCLLALVKQSGQFLNPDQVAVSCVRRAASHCEILTGGYLLIQPTASHRTFGVRTVDGALASWALAQSPFASVLPHGAVVVGVGHASFPSLSWWLVCRSRQSIP